MICQRDIISKEDYDSFGKTWIFGTYADAPKAWNNGSKMITDYDYN